MQTSYAIKQTSYADSCVVFLPPPHPLYLLTDIAAFGAA